MLIKNRKARHCVKACFLAALMSFNSCDWLDVVPEGLPSIELTFNSRAEAIKYLSNCYGYLPNHASPNANPAILGGDEIWTHQEPFTLGGLSLAGFNLAQGMQNSNSPIFGIWNSQYIALRECNIFLENVYNVPDLPSWERDQWIAEVLVLKAYYHFNLVQMYGPIPLLRENVPIHLTVTDMKIVREPVDECFAYIVELLDAATIDDALPMKIVDELNELGRITKPIALALKAKVLVTAASPLFNGNDQQAALRNHDGTQLFNQTPDPEKWVKAMIACKQAIEACHDARAGIKLFEYPNTGTLTHSSVIATQLSLRNAFTLRWNDEIIWANTNSVSGRTPQYMVAPYLDRAIGQSATGSLMKDLGVPMKIAEMFYTQNGVPMEEDKTRDISIKYELREAVASENLYVKEGDVTVDMHFDREPRFYAWIGFDMGIWHGQGRLNEQNELFTLDLKYGALDNYRWLTGYLPKKWIPYTNTMSMSGYSMDTYPWPIMRLSDLYLLYAEAINEVEGPDGENSGDLFDYIDFVRLRAGLREVKYSWDTHGITKKYETKNGMRQIIQQERMIELCFEGHRFWDIRRWRIAPEIYRTPIEGWNSRGQLPQDFYTKRFLFQQTFRVRDYFWPIADAELDRNPDLVQNLDW